MLFAFAALLGVAFPALDRSWADAKGGRHRPRRGAGFEHFQDEVLEPFLEDEREPSALLTDVEQEP